VGFQVGDDGRRAHCDASKARERGWLRIGLGSGCDRVTREGRERIDLYWSLGGTHTVRVAGSLGGTHTVKVDSYELAFPLASRPVPPSGRRGANGNGYGSILGFEPQEEFIGPFSNGAASGTWTSAGGDAGA